jgi:putative tricarboxylic transport membrane protein
LKKLNFNSYVSMLFVALGAIILLIIPSQIEKPLVIFGQSDNALNPTLFPSLVAMGFLLLGIWGFVKSFSIDETNGLVNLDREAYINVGVIIMALFAYALLMEPLGFIPSSAILVGGLSYFFGIRNLPMIFLVGIGVPVSIYFIFTNGLKVFLPEIPWI